MPLIKLEDYYPNYRETFAGDDIKKLDLYTEGGDKVGSIQDVLVDDNGRFRYLVIDAGTWAFGKKILLPVGLSHIDYDRHRVFVDGLSKEQVQNLPAYKENLVVDYDHEEQLRGIYRPLASTTTAGTGESIIGSESYNSDTYSYDREPYLYNMKEEEGKTLRLYEERLIANKERRKVGEVAVGKRVETETARVSVPVEKERIVIERTTPADSGAVNINDADFREGEVARIEVYEERANIEKQAFVREEVSVRKEVERQTVEAEETIRREELDINAEGNPVLDNPNRI